MKINPFVPSGRIPRRVYIPAMLLMNAIMLISEKMGDDSSGILAILSFVILWPFAMFAIQRAHDIGKPTWFAIAWMVLAVFATVLNDMDPASGVLVIAGIISAIAALVMGIMLAFRRGDVGENEFGPDPLNPDRSVAFE